ncbi:ImmA/IrrE family metallo-endopeptidase [Sphingomonas pokkalii]|uniref:ImmA/IrrE family metallo-endopeptidase n=1 Tax=Sphingomonas pokkalii TaxID=2175090 RepID=A0A2U0SC45_9SPHN|nr:ImmA/IrrE family metallo-endopeptidase [Sphingomonas pokkalii]PVX28946.1 ImmA/IrrE family metallo-endopeptidase [Sphingomonas pokkalii]
MTTLYSVIAEAQRNAPVDPAALARKLGIAVKPMLLDDDMSGALVKVTPDKYEIQVNALHPETRQRFTIAHELGHYVHHRALLGEGVNDNRAYRTTQGDKLFNPKIGPKQETEANRFAASLLMPAAAVERLRAEGMTTAQMASHLGVSQHAMSIRLGVPYEPA